MQAQLIFVYLSRESANERERAKRTRRKDEKWMGRTRTKAGMIGFEHQPKD